MTNEACAIMTHALTLTVILPTYNERDNVPILIEGILRHVTTPVQVLVVDDDSPDGTWKVVEIASAEPRAAPAPAHRTWPDLGDMGRDPGV
jgi:dolichol-phosphate mannosyltransferase